MARVILALAWFVAGAACAAEPDALARIRARLDAHPQVRAEFVQTRTSPDLQRPLVTRGRMVVWGQAGVIWDTAQPVKNTVALRPDSTVSVDARGRRAERSAQDDAVAARIGRVMSALLNGDTGTLEKWFRVAAQLDGARWTITLTPHRGPLASFIQTMELGGADFLESVAIADTAGEATRIEFSNHRAAAPLSPDERDLLGTP